MPRAPRSRRPAPRDDTSTNVKYAAFGYSAKPEDYAAGVWALHPSVMLAWDRLDFDATRLVFRDEG